MAPPMVLLKRHVDFSHDEAEAVSAAVSIPSPCPWGASNKVKSDAVIEYLRALKARAVVASPPQLSSLRILPPPNSAPLLGLGSGRISSADKNLVALAPIRLRRWEPISSTTPGMAPSPSSPLSPLTTSIWPWGTSRPSSCATPP
uniref:Uncharacterized protein n=1 Tax=Aegilops tauschii TaxID=37682 RepID=N1QRP0_AEGTA